MTILGNSVSNKYDISSNPVRNESGIVKSKCNACARTIARNHRTVVRKSCDVQLDFKCAGLSVKDYQCIHSDSNRAWECSVCVSSTNFGTSSFPNVEIMWCLEIVHININRLYNKLNNDRDLLQFYRFDILPITETWLTSNVIDNEIHIDGYSLYRKDRISPTEKSGGGCFIYVRNNLVYNEQDIASNNSECIWIESNRQQCRSLFICCVYRPEEQDVSSYFYCKS